MDGNGLRSVAGLLLYGDADSADRVAGELVARHDPHMWELLVGTIQSNDESVSVRIRCLDVLAKAASLDTDETASAIFAALGAATTDRSPSTAA